MIINNNQIRTVCSIITRPYGKALQILVNERNIGQSTIMKK